MAFSSSYCLSAAAILAFAEWARLGYLPQFGVDVNLIVRAREAGKRIVELEGAQAQADLMASLTPEQSRQAFEGTVAALESGLTREQIDGMVEAWRAGNPGKLLEVARKYNERVPEAKALEEKFIWSRHEEMAKKIEEYLMQGSERVFVAVGALHLAGPRGLVEMLAKRGYQVRQPMSANREGGRILVEQLLVHGTQKPQGAFYVFPNITATGMGSTELANLILEKAGVASLPGNSFGTHGEGYLRISYANSLENIEKGLERILSIL